MGPVGVQEMMVIFLVALVLFGPKKLPELGKTIGKAITEFRRAQSELKATFETHMRELEKEGESIREVTRSYTNEIVNHYNGYDSPSFSESITYPGADSHSIQANPSTVSVPAPQGAESSVSPTEAPVNGTVSRTVHGSDNSGQTVSETAAPESINT
jgi:sec-independent protein translocase protein TatA